MVPSVLRKCKERKSDHYFNGLFSDFLCYNKIERVRKMEAIVMTDNNIQQDTAEHSLAYELLVEVKASARRWFVISMVELVILLTLITGMLWYFTLPSEEYSEQTVDQDMDGINNTMIGIGDNNGEGTSASP